MERAGGRRFPRVLRPETAHGYEAGFKGTALDGALDWKACAFLVDFRDRVVASSTGALVNAGGERLRGTEFEARWQATPDLALIGNLALHDARYTRYLYSAPDTGLVYNVGGNRLPMSPRVLAAAGLLYTPPTGLYASLVAHHVGHRYLDVRNTAAADGYTTYAATVGYRLGWDTVALESHNLGDRRPPVTASEFGSESFYLLNGRTLWLRFTHHLSPSGASD